MTNKINYDCIHLENGYTQGVLSVLCLHDELLFYYEKEEDFKCKENCPFYKKNK